MALARRGDDEHCRCVRWSIHYSFLRRNDFTGSVRGRTHWLIAYSKLSPRKLLAAASLGNVLGSAANCALGRGIEHFKERPWFPAKGASMERAQRWYQRYGKWSLLLSWVPIIGDPLTVVAGVLREPFFVFLIFVTLAKVGRYLVLTAIVLRWM